MISWWTCLMPWSFARLPLWPTVNLAPRGPNESDPPNLLKFGVTPGAILILLQKRKPIPTYHQSVDHFSKMKDATPTYSQNSMRIGLLKSVFRVIVNRSMACPPSLWRSGRLEGLSAVFVAGWPAHHLLTASFTGGRIQGLRMTPIHKLLSTLRSRL